MVRVEKEIFPPKMGVFGPPNRGFCLKNGIFVEPKWDFSAPEWGFLQPQNWALFTQNDQDGKRDFSAPKCGFLDPKIGVFCLKNGTFVDPKWDFPAPKRGFLGPKMGFF